MHNRPELPFDAERVSIQDGDWVMGGNGKVYAIYGWYYTSFQARALRVVYRAGSWVETDEETVIAPETTLLVTRDELTGKTDRQVRRMHWERYRSGPGSEYSRGQIREHRAAVAKLNLPRDDHR